MGYKYVLKIRPQLSTLFHFSTYISYRPYIGGLYFRGKIKLKSTSPYFKGIVNGGLFGGSGGRESYGIIKFWLNFLTHYFCLNLLNIVFNK